jgi:hypothetical protein
LFNSLLLLGLLLVVVCCCFGACSMWLLCRRWIASEELLIDWGTL